MTTKKNETSGGEMLFGEERKKQSIPAPSCLEDGDNFAEIAEQVASEREQMGFPSRKEENLPIVHRVSSKQRRLSLNEYRATFLQVPRIVNRRPVFVSEEVRQQLDLIVLRLAESRRMSVTGLLENICRHHIETYKNDIEQWRKL